MRRTTIQANEELLLEVKQLAEEQRTTVSQIIRGALEEYLYQHRQGARALSFVGIGSSGRKDISRDVENIIAAQVEKGTGWGE